MPTSRCDLFVATSPAPGAVAIMHLHGCDAVAVLRSLTGHNDWRQGVVRLARFGDIDTGMAVVLREGEDAFAQLMPHGGPRVVQRIVDRLVSLGAVYNPKPDSRAVYPEASCAIEADALSLLARAASPAAVDLLLAQPPLWLSIASGNQADITAMRRRSRILSGLVDPASVVVVGRPNVGKSTLANRVFGRAASLVADLPGTTRDWVAGLAELHWRIGGDDTTDSLLRRAVAVRWTDTPGLRASDDAIEQAAIVLARGVIATADVLVALRDPQTDWPDAGALSRTPDLWVMNKSDLLTTATHDGLAPDRPLHISAARGDGVEQLEQRILLHLGLTDALAAPMPWAFSPTLVSWMETGDMAALRRYTSPADHGGKKS